VIPFLRALRLENTGLARLVRHKENINRVVLYRRPGDPHPATARQYRGANYSFEQPLSDGHHCWRLRHLRGRACPAPTLSPSSYFTRFATTVAPGNSPLGFIVS
jgi:hypothetical protein